MLPSIYNLKPKPDIVDRGFLTIPYYMKTPNIEGF